MVTYGPFWFGFVIGFVTYRTLKHKAATGISDIAAVIGAIGGAGVLKLFPAGSDTFDLYAVGLASGFFLYLLLSIGIAAVFLPREGSGKKAAQVAKEFLGG